MRRLREHRVATALGVVAVLAAVGYALGLYSLPNIEKLIEDAGRHLGRWTYLLVGVMAFLETGAFVGLIAPGETVILVGGLVAGQGEIDIVVLIAIVWACAVAGDMTSFLLGRRLGRDFLVTHGPKVKITEDRIEQVERFFERHGGKAIFLGRFVGLVRAVAPFLAGSGGMPLRRFAPYDIVGAGLWGSTFALLGYLFWDRFSAVLDYAKKGAFALAATIVFVVALVNAARWLKEPENRARLRAWADDKPVLGPLVRRGERPARFVWNRVTPGDLGLELTTLLAVLSVGLFAFVGYLVEIQDVVTTSGDRRAMRIAEQLYGTTLVDVAKVVTHLGALPVAGGILLVAVVVLLVRREILEGVALAAGMTLTVVAVHVTKAAEDRPRPPGPLVEADGSSFPSGHAAYAIAWVAVAVAVARALGGVWSRTATVVVAIAIAVAVAATRVYLRVHYLSDVVAGAGLGAACFAFAGGVALVVAHVRHNGARA